MTDTLKEIWARAENLGYSPSIMATPGHGAGNYLAHLFDKNGEAVRIKGSDGSWADTPEKALLHLVAHVEPSATLSTNSDGKANA